MPKIVAKRLEKLQRDFLWGGGSLERKVHLINWEVVCTQKEKGGLSIRKIDPWNKALLGRIWVQTKEARGTYGVGVWKEIMKEAKWCWDSIKFKVGKGTRVKFWTDQWDFRISSEEDSVLWKGGGHGIFGVKDAYNVLVVPNACAFPTKCIWVDKISRDCQELEPSIGEQLASLLYLEPDSELMEMSE
ncbi:30-kDa cleavage and polyadenylation specificity factor 30 [Vitis vinifera]|uniref:30-kDa cleavage and polyadenylation specificity factor 30 n=1 Tax=Vitis vinifera TaxID=29760 RepID=A0A438INY6_VITVI|nr:30-kDa cleavage and polyadenylation specificity factor 30 [Vitis vinifera]